MDVWMCGCHVRQARHVAEQLGTDYHEFALGGLFNSRDTFPQLLTALLACVAKVPTTS